MVGSGENLSFAGCASLHYSRTLGTFPKYRIGVVPNCFRNIDINALGLL
jgi:hypothetical protein